MTTQPTERVLRVLNWMRLVRAALIGLAVALISPPGWHGIAAAACLVIAAGITDETQRGTFR